MRKIEKSLFSGTEKTGHTYYKKERIIYMCITSNKLSFDLWLESEYSMDEREYSRMSKQMKNDIRSEYDDYLHSED